jgi:hypothetical protein
VDLQVHTSVSEKHNASVFNSFHCTYHIWPYLESGARRWLFTAETRVQSRVTSSEIHGGRSGWDYSRFVSQFFGAPLLIIIPPLLHTHLSPPYEVCDSPDQAAHYHTLGPKLGAASLTRHLAGLGVKLV